MLGELNDMPIELAAPPKVPPINDDEPIGPEKLIATVIHANGEWVRVPLDEVEGATTGDKLARIRQAADTRGVNVQTTEQEGLIFVRLTRTARLPVPETRANHNAMHWALDAAPHLIEKGMSVYEILTFIIIARHSSQADRTASLSYRTIANEGAMSTDSAHRAMKKLVAAGLVSIIRNTNGGVNSYQIAAPTLLLPTTGGSSL